MLRHSDYWWKSGMTSIMYGEVTIYPGKKKTNEDIFKRIKGNCENNGFTSKLIFTKNKVYATA